MDYFELAKSTALFTAIIGGVWRIASKITALTIVVETIKDNDIPHIYNEVKGLRQDFTNHLIKGKD